MLLDHKGTECSIQKVIKPREVTSRVNFKFVFDLITY